MFMQCSSHYICTKVRKREKWSIVIDFACDCVVGREAKREATMARTLRNLLLEPWGGAKKPLFPSQREIATRISERPGSSYAGKRDSLAVFVNQIIAHSRPCPEALSEELLLAASEAAENIGADLKQVDRELRSVLFETPRARPLTVSDLLHRQISAEEVVIVNPETLENRGHPRDDEFIDATVSALMDNSNARYRFFIDRASPRAYRKQKEGIQKGLERRLENDNKSAAGAKKQLDELLSSKRLRITKIDTDRCIIPVVAFDPSQPDSRADLYVWDWSFVGDGVVEDYIAKLSPNIKKKWLDVFYETYLRNMLERSDDNDN